MNPATRIIALGCLVVSTAYSQEREAVENRPASGNSPAAEARAGDAGQRSITTSDGKYEILIDTSETPDLEMWVNEKVVPVVREWYPKLVEMLPSEGFEAPQKLSVSFQANMRGVAATSGTRIRCSGEWISKNREGEAVGAIVHELVHVVQQYGRARRNNPEATRTPGWLVEGIADYLRWFRYEPESKGAEITSRNLERARHDGSYRITANFLNWVTEKYDRETVRKLNAAAREGKYQVEIWEQITEKSLEELGKAWKAEHALRLESSPAQ